MARTGFTDMIGQVLKSAGQRRPRGVDAAFSIGDLRRLAEKRLPRGPFGYMDGAAEDEVALRRNSEGFADYRLVGHTLRDVSEIDTSHTILGTPSSLPILMSPTGFGRLFHHEGERASARAAEQAGIIFTLSTLGTVSIEDVASVARGPRWFQLYVWKDRSIASDLIQRAKDSGYETLVLTVDTPVAGRRERDYRNGFTIPPTVGLKTLLDGARKPSWWYGFMTTEPLDFAVVSRYTPGGTGPGGVMGYINSQFDQTLSWDDAAQLREEWAKGSSDRKFVIKGVQCVEDARRCVEIGADAVMLSNHGGRQLDHAVAPIDLLPEVLDEVGGQIATIVDGGIRRGTDILKALALGADACSIGRAYLYGLGAGGERGVARAIELLAYELKVAMTLAGCRSVKEIDSSVVRRVS
ncbi:MAG TPA: alpha-hydroxy acid oxidase [Acidimicrobiales bacterium]|nr:alpha-hydroxy acid oxidase [Acidimicrobiales bacterium]